MKIIDKIGMAIVRENRLLIVRNRGTQLFLVPGGQSEDNEADMQTLSREIKEELTAEIRPGEIKYIGEYEDIAANNADSVVRIKLYYGSITGDIRIANEIAEYRWFDPKHDDRNALSAIIKNKIIPDLLARKIL